ncbi:peptidoglycan-binding protein [Bacillus siamensis]|nr:peptidoglycan-binding protein [Bacillus siamensis]
MCIIPRNEVAYHVTKNFGIDGAYGTKTEDAVRRFQLMNGLKADGINGPDTTAKLEVLFK